MKVYKNVREFYWFRKKSGGYETVTIRFEGKNRIDRASVAIICVDKEGRSFPIPLIEKEEAFRNVKKGSLLYVDHSNYGSSFSIKVSPELEKINLSLDFSLRGTIYLIDKDFTISGTSGGID